MLFALLLAAWAAVAASAQSPLTVTGAWVREPVPGQPAAAAYAVLENAGADAVQVVSVTADAAGVSEIHEMTRSGDMMKMAPVKSLAVPAKGKVELKPGGLHVMLFKMTRPLEDGDTVTLTFTTSTGATVKTTAPVRKVQVKP